MSEKDKNKTVSEEYRTQMSFSPQHKNSLTFLSVAAKTLPEWKEMLDKCLREAKEIAEV